MKNSKYRTRIMECIIECVIALILTGVLYYSASEEYKMTLLIATGLNDLYSFGKLIIALIKAKQEG